MLPSLETYFWRRALAVAVVTSVAGTVLASSLTRNAPSLSITQAIAGLGALSASWCYGLVRDSRGYWAYVLRAGKIFGTASRQKHFLDMRPPAFGRLLSDRASVAALFAWLATALLCVVANAFASGYLKVFALIHGAVLLPTMALGFMAAVMVPQVQDALRSPAGGRETPDMARIDRMALGDLAFSLVVNLALVLPIRNRPAFSLERGSDTPTFVIAFALLLVIVCAYMVFFATRTRRLSIAGELLMMGGGQGLVQATSPMSASKIPERPACRIAAYLVLTAVWAVIVCETNACVSRPVGFVCLYLIALTPLACMSFMERRWTLLADFRDAHDIRRRIVATMGAQSFAGAKADSAQ